MPVKKEIKPKEVKPKKDELNVVIKPLTEKELKKNFNYPAYGDVNSVEKFNSLNFKDKWFIEYNVNKMLDSLSQEYVNKYFDSSGDYNESKFLKAVDRYTAKFKRTLMKLRKKKNKKEFVDFLKDLGPFDLSKYRFIF